MCLCMCSKEGKHFMHDRPNDLPVAYRDKNIWSVAGFFPDLQLNLDINMSSGSYFPKPLCPVQSCERTGTPSCCHQMETGNIFRQIIRQEGQDNHINMFDRINKEHREVKSDGEIQTTFYSFCHLRFVVIKQMNSNRQK